MQRLSVFLFTSILGKKMYDEFDDVLGELKDIYVTPNIKRIKCFADNLFIFSPPTLNINLIIAMR